MNCIVLRTELALNEMVHQRSLYGFRDSDTATALTAAREGVRVADTLENPALQGLAYFWYGLALYYSGDSYSAGDAFEMADQFGECLIPDSREKYWLQSWVDEAQTMEVCRRKEDYWSQALLEHSEGGEEEEEEKKKKKKGRSMWRRKGSTSSEASTYTESNLSEY